MVFISFFSLYRKARRKERDGDSNQGDTKLYLEEGLLERKLPDADLRLLVDLPAGLDYNEWLASHSKCTRGTFRHLLVMQQRSPEVTQSLKAPSSVSSPIFY